MKKIYLVAVLFVMFATATFFLTSFKTTPVKPLASKGETCTDWARTGIQFRQCETDYGARSHQFYNGYAFQVYFYDYLEYTDGTNSGNNENEYIDANSSGDKTGNGNSSGTSHVVKTWRITKKERKDASGKWVQF